MLVLWNVRQIDSMLPIDVILGGIFIITKDREYLIE